MDIKVGTLGVNAAFLREIKEDHRELTRLFDEAVALFARAARTRVPARKIIDVLECLRDQLALHFSLEEAFGYFEDAITVAPRLSARADALRSEHGTLYIELCEVVEEAERLLRADNSSRAVRRIALQFVAFHHQYQAHDSAENELILTALDDDIGVGD
ncbi:MAG: hemerythrin domain-containing protein [Pirellulaceae bacterium]